MPTENGCTKAIVSNTEIIKLDFIYLFNKNKVYVNVALKIRKKKLFIIQLPPFEGSFMSSIAIYAQPLAALLLGAFPCRTISGRGVQFILLLIRLRNLWRVVASGSGLNRWCDSGRKGLVRNFYNLI